MKLNVCTITLVGLVACSVAAFAQDTQPAGDPPAQGVSETTPSEAAQPETAENTPPDAGAVQPLPGAVEVAQAATGGSPGAATAAASGEAQPGTVIPLIVMDDVPLTDAIKNLARQAGLNHMLDPKVAFGQVGPDGKPVPQPMVTIRWENVTAEQALSALLDNYSLQLMEDPKSKIARVTVKDPAAPDPLVTKIIQLDYASPTNMVMAIQNTFVDKRSKVVPDLRTSQLVVLATEKEIVDVETLVDRLDTPTKQVLIEARLLETSLNPSTKKGIDWTGTLDAQKLVFGNNLRQHEPEDSLNNTLVEESLPRMLFDTAKGFNPGTAFLDADGVSAVLSFLNKNSEAKVLSAPRTVTLDNEMARISVTRASPIINVTPGTVQVAGGSQITYTNLGIILEVTPRISANNLINLKVVPEVSRVFDTVRKVVDQGLYEADQYDIRKMETRVVIPSGNTLVLGGLVQDDIRKGNVKVPVLGDIPYIGGMFRSDEKKRQKSNLLVFLTPTIVEDSDFQPTKTEFLKSPVPTSDSLEDDWTSWDSGKPKDWKKSEKEQLAEVNNPEKFSPLPDPSQPKVTEVAKPAEQPKASESTQPAEATTAQPSSDLTATAPVPATDSKFSDLPVE